MLIRQILAELATPSNQVGPLDRPYRRAVIGVGHAIVGASRVGLASRTSPWRGLLADQGAWRPSARRGYS
jgi:hypothetical protein